MIMRRAAKPALNLVLAVTAMLVWIPARATAAAVERGIVVLVEFRDVKHGVDRRTVQTRFGTHLNNYVRQMSYNRVALEIDVTAHILGGVKGGTRAVPCLYDHDLQARPGPLRETFLEAMINMGYWDPMSCHFIQRGTPPPGISSWTRLRLNWMEPAKVRIVKPREKAEILLGPLEVGSSENLAIKIPVSDTAYYLVENRQPIGVFDSQLPGSGVLIMYADDSVAECRQGKGGKGDSLIRPLFSRQ